ncbi:bifunctional 4-hydroxy-2-oxoglutarate aldolase/2-dehydro-3-deoxy-phosphogluconate aldolase [Pseudoteredinibacter isoporae]|uniref:2-dehydro-3-deoxy-phosphogluconate aldolase n=1 Tax=Pseudoteredinibacter isoporae TaxID=570281 RepID=A0A7X0JRJ8_9GAMM|nr:bifunctional 4-hydroxy-2-oxoglutarate aldolase/2-dehydro-3-deoxy-phosphogluconate aldolase [Pseudoteredinibacter isoporae]MBB6520061.1 2-dehydro-3-deoxyphosphogluconate aldolase/(4S)-4-hydroxy-2-oxoglutarate aldolase [Pseudoteredinibacter isoporae]NHO85633.1 bifunctional 4-hydroxy-2-oxoglutarate aldolase/2-dehydro-3-deoxy-phosphogluconate aldolase [Pseudoteredinibacter isoporae]NIB25915.1 bifunctional 4-hydroxy-2-oxoglutarate aldolase/2-dehydro-3-deoxy-phosphogluconate aldolase [Pseudoteredin
MSRIEEIMTSSPVIPVIVIDDLADAVPMAKALLSGGLKVLEVTLRTEHGLAAIRKIKQELPEAIVGAGTVISAEDAENSVAAGAEFLVSPGHTDELVDRALALGVPILPGVATPSEAMKMLAKGIRHLKFFPAEAVGGLKVLKAIAGPLPQLRFCPTGGINPEKAIDYLAQNNILCVGGSWMLEKGDIADKNWAAIESKAREAASLAG